jgi:hypothetical protein
LNPRFEIGRERRRQIQVRKALEAGLRDGNAAAELVDFFTGCGEYMVFSMDRLHAQDQMIHDLLAERIPASDRQAHQRLAELNARQARSRALMAEFRDSLERLKTSGAAGLGAFREAGSRFVRNFTGLLAPRRNPFEQYTNELFSAADWVAIAGVTDDSLAREAALFVAIQRSAPARLDPDRMVVEFH